MSNIENFAEHIEARNLVAEVVGKCMAAEGVTKPEAIRLVKDTYYNAALAGLKERYAVAGVPVNHSCWNGMTGRKIIGAFIEMERPDGRASAEAYEILTPLFNALKAAKGIE